jgi:sulfur transfer complex TusBCD TusB component (DsrH family)
MSPQAKRTRGRAQGSTIIDHEKFISDVKQHIHALWAKSRSAHQITREAVARTFQLAGDDVSAAGLRKRLVRCGIQVEWRDFVEVIVRERG